MTPYRRALLRKAIHFALKLRVDRGRPLDRPLCVFDLADELGLVVEFRSYQDTNYEGIFLPGARSIQLEPARPSGRQRFTCAHELGHHRLDHGHVVSCTDQEQVNTSQEELLANTFASFLLMPKIAIHVAFSRRGTSISAGTPLDYYVVAGWFGVGYTNLLWHCYRNLEQLTEERYEQLKRVGLPKIREQLANGQLDKEDSKRGALFLVDENWTSRPLDLAVGDRMMTPLHFDPPSILKKTGDGLFIAVKPGNAVLADPQTGWSVRLRVFDPSKEGFWRVLWDIEEDDE